MPLYQYRAFDVDGKKKSGLIEAMDERAAKAKLREQGVMVAELSLKKRISSAQNIKGNHLLTFTLQLSQLVNSGIPLYESMLAIEEQSRNEPYHRIILSLCDQIKSGTPLSAAMATYPASFNSLYCSMVTAGESAGALDIVLEKLSQLLVKQNKLKTQISTAMIYPVILASFSFLVIALLLGFVVPSIEGVFAERKLNKFTTSVLAISHFFREYWAIYIPIIVIAVTFTVYKLRSPSGRLWLERMLLKIPVINTLIIQAAIARFCRTMSTLLEGGLTMIDSLRIARGTMFNVTLEEEIAKGEAKIIEGSSLAAELLHSKYFPPMVARMMAIAEESGSTVTMLNKIAEMYEGELEKTLDTAMALAQPAILIFMGTIIGTVMMAILLPLTDISSFSI